MRRVVPGVLLSLLLAGPPSLAQDVADDAAEPAIPLPPRWTLGLGVGRALHLDDSPYRLSRRVGPDLSLAFSWFPSGQLGGTARLVMNAVPVGVEERSPAAGVTTVSASSVREYGAMLLGPRVEAAPPGGEWAQQCRVGLDLLVGAGLFDDRLHSEVIEGDESVLRLTSSNRHPRLVVGLGADTKLHLVGRFGVRVGLLALWAPPGELPAGSPDAELMRSVRIEIGPYLQSAGPREPWRQRDLEVVESRRQTWLSNQAGTTFGGQGGAIGWKKTGPDVTSAIGYQGGSGLGVVLRAATAPARSPITQSFPHYFRVHDQGWVSAGLRLQRDLPGELEGGTLRVGMDLGAGVMLSRVELQDLDRQPVEEWISAVPLAVGSMDVTWPARHRWAGRVTWEPTYTFGTGVPTDRAVRAFTDAHTSHRVMLGIVTTLGRLRPARPAR